MKIDKIMVRRYNNSIREQREENKKKNNMRHRKR